MASFTIVGNNIHSGNRSGSIIFTSTDRDALKREYMRLAFSKPTPVAPASADQPLLKVATAQLAMATKRIIELEAKLVQMEESLGDELVARVGEADEVKAGVETVLTGYTARKNSAAWKAGLQAANNMATSDNGLPF